MPTQGSRTPRTKRWSQPSPNSSGEMRSARKALRKLLYCLPLIISVFGLILYSADPGLFDGQPALKGYLGGLTDAKAQQMAAQEQQQDYPCISPEHPYASPPPDFDPVTATDGHSCYGLPAKPTDPKALQAWTFAMQHISGFAYPAWLAEQVPHRPSLMQAGLTTGIHPSAKVEHGIIGTNGDIGVWGGYIDDNWCNSGACGNLPDRSDCTQNCSGQNDNPNIHKVFEASSYWTVPQAVLSSSGKPIDDNGNPIADCSQCGPTSPWVGGVSGPLNTSKCADAQTGNNGGCIIQAGTDSLPPGAQLGVGGRGPKQYSWWYEDYPDNTRFFCTPSGSNKEENCPPLAPGDLVWVDVQYATVNDQSLQETPGISTVMMENISQSSQPNNSVVFQVSTPYYYNTDSSGAVVLEDQAVATGLSWQYTPVTFQEPLISEIAFQSCACRGSAAVPTAAPGASPTADPNVGPVYYNLPLSTFNQTEANYKYAGIYPGPTHFSLCPGPITQEWLGGSNGEWADMFTVSHKPSVQPTPPSC